MPNMARKINSHNNKILKNIIRPVEEDDTDNGSDSDSTSDISDEESEPESEIENENADTENDNNQEALKGHATAEEKIGLTAP